MRLCDCDTVLNNMFQPYSWYISKNSEDVDQYQLMVWALDENNETCLIRINRFCHYVHIRIPDIMPDREIINVVDYIRSIADYGPSYDPKIVMGKPLYYYGPQRRFIRCTLHSYMEHSRLHRAFNSKNSKLMKIPGVSLAYEYEICDMSVDPIIKYLGFNINDESLTMRHCHWFTIRNTYEAVISVYSPVEPEFRDKLKMLPRLPLHFSSCNAVTNTESISVDNSVKTPTAVDITLVIECESIDRAHTIVQEQFGNYRCWSLQSLMHRSGLSLQTGNKISRVNEYVISANDMLHVPHVNKISKPRILAFDIETYSSGAYEKPGVMPDKMNSEDIIFSISYSIYDNATKECVEGLFTVIPPELQSRMQQGIDSAERLRQYNIEMCDDETDMLQSFFDLIIEASPTVIIGFNSLGYDWPQIIARWESAYCKSERIPNLSLLINHKTASVAKAWSSEQGMSVSATYPSMPGRIHLDLHDIIKSEMKLPNYSLEVVSRIVLGEGKEDVTYTEMFVRYHKLIHKIGDMDDNIEKMVQVLVYSAVDAALVTRVFNRRNCWINLIVACNVMYVVPQDRYMRGTQHSNFNLITTRAIASGFMINKYSGVPRKYRGAVVQDPVPGYYENIPCADFTSLYPTVIVAYNLCFTTLCRPADRQYFDLTEQFVIDSPDGGTNTYHFVKRENYEGILPKHVTSLVNSRNDVKKQLSAHAALTKRVKSSIGKWLRITGMTVFQSEIIDIEEPGAILITEDVVLDFENESARLDATQLNYKICANSAYGMMGAQNGGKLCLVAGADTTTYMGRYWIERVNTVLREKYGARIVYGDTDSTMFDMGIKDPKLCDEIATRIISELNTMFPKPMKLEYEKSMGVMICLKKKRYMAYLLHKGVLNKKSPLIKGVLSVRRDNCKWQRTIFNNIACMCLDRKSPMDILLYIAQECQELREGRVDVQDLIITTGISDKYKKEHDPRAIMKKRMLNSHGIELTQGMRVEYILTRDDAVDQYGKSVESQVNIVEAVKSGGEVIAASGKMRKGDMMLLASVYNDILTSGGRVSINYDEYIRIISKQVDNMFNICYGYLNTQLPYHGMYFHGHIYHITSPCNMLYKAIHNSHGHELNLVNLMKQVLSGPNIHIMNKVCARSAGAIRV